MTIDNTSHLCDDIFRSRKLTQIYLEDCALKRKGPLLLDIKFNFF